jgi:hypothetical protein
MPTVAQSLASLELANGVRCARAEQKRRLRELPSAAARDRAAFVLIDPPGELERMQIGDLLAAIPGVGAWRIRRLLAPGLQATNEIGRISLHRRQRLAAALRSGCPR